MPEIIEQNRRNVVRDKKSVCGSCTCCFYPFSRNKVKEEHVEAEENNETNTAPTTDAPPPPFFDDLPADIGPGSCISLHGSIQPQCSRFAVNLQCKRDPKSDIAAHINPRLSQKYVVRNSRINGSWGEEETTSIAKFELERNKKFDLDIFLTETEFLVSINGKHICAFVFRIPLSKVKVLQVEGAVQVYDVEYRNLQIYPQPSPQNEPFTVPMGEGHDKDNAEQLDIGLISHEEGIPITGVLPGGFQQGWQLEIYGRVKILPFAFYINLQEGTQLWPHPTVALHLNPRFSGMYRKDVLVRNAWINGQWGPEERTSSFPFSPGAPFSVAIRKQDDHFSVWVDGILEGEFKFRNAVDKINAVYIHGDVIIQRLYMKQRIDHKYCLGTRQDLRPVAL